MGIRFFCPNGHKLNVKSFLAGKRGICPKCGASMRIPQESLVASHANSAEAAPPADEAEDAFLDSIQESLASTATSEDEARTTKLPEAPSSDHPGKLPEEEMSLLDPIAEEPSALWYVRPTSGNQFGPADGDVMRRWINEGRVSGDSLVWREGWLNWRKAQSEFPELEENQKDSPSSSSATGNVGDFSVQSKEGSPATTPSTMDRYRVRRRKSNGLAMTAVVILGLLSIALAVVFVAVIVFK